MKKKYCFGDLDLTPKTLEIRLPEDLIEEIKDLMEIAGYESIEEFVEVAVRRFTTQLRILNKK